MPADGGCRTVADVSSAAQVRSSRAGTRSPTRRPARADGPVVVLLHGLASDSDTWDRAIGPLAAHGLRVIAARPARARAVGQAGAALPARRLRRVAARVPRRGRTSPAATMCGHSLGGAIAVHFGYHYPERVERLVLVSAGGLGREVHPVLRAAALPVAPAAARGRDAPAAAAAVRPPRPAPRAAADAGQPDQPAPRRAGRSAPPTGGRRSSPRCAASSSRPASAARSSRCSTWPSTCRRCSCGTRATGDPGGARARGRARTLPGSRLVVFPGGGHEPHRRNAEPVRRRRSRPSSQTSSLVCG